MSNEKMRADFENWAVGRCNNEHSIDEYNEVVLNFGWEAWQAALTQQPESEPEYLISACYFPGTGEVELTYEQNFGRYESVALTLPVTEAQGKSLVRVIDPCVYYKAQPPQVPEGWKLVPEKDLTDWVKNLKLSGVKLGGMETLIRGVIDAAPEPPQGESK